MSIQDAFSHEEWSRIIQSPVMVGFAITAADPGGLVGAMQEAGAMAGKIGKSDVNDAPIVAAIKTALQTAEGRGAAQVGIKDLVKGRKPSEAAQAAVARLKEVMATVAAKEPGEAKALAAYLRSIAQSVAEAAKEGGFLGFGGKPISDAEHATLAEIDDALSLAGT